MNYGATGYRLHRSRFIMELIKSTPIGIPITVDFSLRSSPDGAHLEISKANIFETNSSSLTLFGEGRFWFQSVVGGSKFTRIARSAFVHLLTNQCLLTCTCMRVGIPLAQIR